MGASVETIVVTPQTGAGAPDSRPVAPMTAVEAATAAARANLEAGKPLFVEPGAPAVPVTPAPVAPAPEAGRPPVTPDPAKPGEQTPPVVPGTPDANVDAGAGDELTIELPFQMEGADKPFSMQADSPETAAILQQLTEEVVTGREARTLVAQASESLQRQEELREYSQVDPVGFLTDFLGNDAETAEELTLFLLTQPTLFNKLKPQLAKLVSDPNELRALAGDVHTKRSTREREATEAIESQRAVKANLAEVQSTVITLLPPDMPDAQRQAFYGILLRDLMDYAEGNNPSGRKMNLLPVHTIPGILHTRMTALGIDAEAATSRAAVALAKRGAHPSGAPALPGVRRTPPPATVTVPRPGAPPAPKPNGAAFAKSAAVKATAGSIPSAGAGTPGAAEPLAAPKNADGSAMTTEQRIAWHRNRIKSGQRTY